MKWIAFDQSTKVSGWCVMEDNQYIDSGIIDFSKNEDTDGRSRQMGVAICNKIAEVQPDVIIIEEVAMQSNAKTLKLLARIQGVAIGFAAAHNIPLHILEPTKWRASLSFQQGRSVQRKQLKEQSLNYIKEHLCFDFSEDRAEACCIAIAAQKIFGFEDEI